MHSSDQPKLRKQVFFPAFLAMFLFIGFYFVVPSDTIRVLRSLHKVLLNGTAGLITLISVFCFVLGAGLLFHPFSRVRIGGADARPLLKRWQWFSISFCSTIATGILYWACAEPLIHSQELAARGISQENLVPETIAVLWHHWSGVAYAVFLIPTILMAWLMYNCNAGRGLSSLLIPLAGPRWSQKFASGVDALCIFSMFAGIASSLATGLIMLSGSFAGLTGQELSGQSTAVLCTGIVVVFVASSISGLMRGIRWLSFVNIILVAGIGIFFFILADKAVLGKNLVPSAFAWGRFLRDISLQGISLDLSQWMKDWPVFYWSSWIGWAPLSALFLGRLTVGYTVRDIILVNFVAPTFVTMSWLLIITTTVTGADQGVGGQLSALVSAEGPAVVLSSLLDLLPYANLSKILVLMSALVCFITTADSNISVMSELSLRGHASDTVRGKSALVKLILGAGIGLISWIMVAWLGIDGLRVLNNLAAFPALFIVLLMVISLITVLVKSGKEYGLDEFVQEGGDRGIEEKKQAELGESLP